jgi:riboflavin transporter FmnP
MHILVEMCMDIYSYVMSGIRSTIGAGITMHMSALLTVVRQSWLGYTIEVSGGLMEVMASCGLAY